MDIFDRVSEVTVNQQPIILQGNLLRLGSHQDIQYDEETRTLMIHPDKQSGLFVSPIMETTSFSRLIASWNAVTPEETTVEIRVRVEVEGNWSQFFSYGKWGLGRKNASTSQEDKLATFSIDTLTLKNKKAHRLQVIAYLERKSPQVDSPRLKLIGLTLDTEQMVFHQHYNIEEVNLPVPQLSQRTVPEIGSHICSPTSVAMVLNYKGENITPEKMAELVMDYGANIYGNWSYNVAVAGALGYESYVAMLTIEDVKELLKAGHPVIASVTVKSEDELSHLPEHEDGTKMTYPHGHLLVIRGLGKVDNQNVVYVNDPSALTNEEVERYYDLKEFMNVWKKVGYIIK